MKKSEVLINIIKEDINLIRYFKIKLVRLRNFDFAAYFRDLEKNFDYLTITKTECDLSDKSQEELKIEEEANIHYDTVMHDAKAHACPDESFVLGAKSDSAKAYHTKGMYAEWEVKKLLNKVVDDYITRGEYEQFIINDWFELNKKKLVL